MQAAMQHVADLSGQLDPSSPLMAHDGAAIHVDIHMNNDLLVAASSNATLQVDNVVDVLSDVGVKLGIAKVVHTGPSVCFHFRELSNFAILGGLRITNADAAEQQHAWISDGDQVEGGTTPLSQVSPNQILAVPTRCLRCVAT